MRTGVRGWDCEASTIDTALAVMGALSAGRYFGGVVAELADTLVARGHRVTLLGAGKPGTEAEFVPVWESTQAERLGVSVVPIPGTRHAERLDQNVASLDVVLDEDALAQLQPLSDQVQGGRYADRGVR